MEKQYEIALSYAHKDQKIAEIIQKELKNIFADRVFMDELCPEELTAAGQFKEQLQDIFNRSNYVVILNSENYVKGTFTLVELEAILQREKEHLFIISINDYTLPDAELCTYLPLKILNSGMEEQMADMNTSGQIYDMVHKKIKKYMIRQSVKEKITEKTYALNVQTIFTQGNKARWKMDYDWNLLGTAYVEDESRRIRAESSWQELWQYIKEDFLWIKENLEPDIMRRIFFNCHLSVAYKLGQIYGDLGQGSGNRNLELVSSNRSSDIVFSFEKEIHYNIDQFYFYKEYNGNDSESKDFICIISIKPRKQANILETVKACLETQGLKYRKICIFQEQMEIRDANTLENIAEYLRTKMHQCCEACGVYGQYTMHLFPDTTVPLMFTLGARTIVPGELVLYEYDPNQNSYEKSLEK